MTTTEIQKLTNDFLNQFREQNIQVQLLVSFEDSNGTSEIFTGIGNYYARIGMANEFIQRDKSQVITIETEEE